MKKKNINIYVTISIPFSFVHHEGSVQADSPVSVNLPHLVQRALPPSFACQVQALPPSLVHMQTFSRVTIYTVVILGKISSIMVKSLRGGKSFWNFVFNIDVPIIKKNANARIVLLFCRHFSTSFRVLVC